MSEEHAAGWTPRRDLAPSLERPDVPTLARVIGGLCLLVFAGGVLPIAFEQAGIPSWLPTGVATIFALMGMGGLLYHAARDSELEIRRAYLVFAFLLVIVGAATGLYPAQAGMGARFLPWGYVALLVALLFFLPALRNETDTVWRHRVIYLMGLLGLALAGTGLIGGSLKIPFLLAHGLLLAVLGLAYLWAFIGFLGTETDLGRRAATAVGVAGGLVFIVALVRSLVLRFGWFGVERVPSYLIDAGVLLMGVGFIYLLLATAICSDWQVLVLMRRELASFFYSPLAYFLLFAFAVMAWFPYLVFVNSLIAATTNRAAMPEPIVWPYIWGLVPVMFLILAVPLLTMRVFSEEKRTQTLEVLLTAPVQETPLVVGKFLAVMIIFVMAWLPYWLYLIALRIEGGQPFDYRPLISFNIALIFSGGGMVAMGLFFSSLTRNQIAAGVMTAMGMIFFMAVFLIKNDFLTPNSTWANVLSYFSFIDLWRNTLQGKLALRELIFHICFAVFFLFLTVKVLEARKWS